MRFLLVTVTDGSPRSVANLDSLLASLADQREDCDLVLVMRGGPVCPRSTPPNVVIHEVRAPLKISLSRARNLALARARARGLLSVSPPGADVSRPGADMSPPGADVSRPGAVAFPDDDNVYPPGTLARAAAHLSSGAEMVCGAYGPSIELVDRGRFPARTLSVDVRLLMSSASSGTMFFAAPLVAALGDFDERLGLGARFGSSEDSDYMIRALAAGAAAVYDPGLVVLHPYKPARHGEYYPGNVAVLAKHAFGPGRTLLPLLRRLAVGLRLLARGDLRPSAYGAALRAAACMLTGGLTSTPAPSRPA